MATDMNTKMAKERELVMQSTTLLFALKLPSRNPLQLNRRWKLSLQDGIYFLGLLNYTRDRALAFPSLGLAFSQMRCMAGDICP